MSKRKARRTYSASQKATILRRHLVDKVAVSDLCDEYRIQPSVFYSWQKHLMDNMEAVLSSSGRRRETAAQESKLSRENDGLKAKLTKKDNVIAEISEEYVALKKELGEL